MTGVSTRQPWKTVLRANAIRRGWLVRFYSTKEEF